MPIGLSRYSVRRFSTWTAQEGDHSSDHSSEPRSVDGIDEDDNSTDSETGHRRRRDHTCDLADRLLGIPSRYHGTGVPLRVCCLVENRPDDNGDRHRGLQADGALLQTIRWVVVPVC